VPVELETESVLHLGRAGAGKAAAADPHARIRGKAVDVVARESCIGDGIESGLHSEVDLRPSEPAAHGGLTDARDDGAAFQPVVAARCGCGAHEASAFADEETGEKSGR
jgi:hypothetical protein